MAVNRLDNLTPTTVSAAGRGRGRARVVLGRGQGRPIVMPPMLLPPPAPEALIGQIPPAAGRAGPLRRPAGGP